VKLGPMVPPLHGDTMILDKPEMWHGKSIEEIVGFRLSLVKGVMEFEVHTQNGRYIELLHELAMSEQSTESEVTFEKRPVPDIEQLKKNGLETESPPNGPVAPIKNFKLSSSIRVDHRIEDVYYDKDLQANGAIISLYSRGLDVSTIQRVFSLGMLGYGNKRKLVPTRWSISAVDGGISSHLIRTIELNPSVDQIEVYKYSHLGNSYSIILVPDQVWSFEMQEAWFDKLGNIGIAIDFEDANGLREYPSNVAGAYFAARLGVTEHLLKRKRKAGVIVLREIRLEEYVLPVGVWQIREGVRQALLDKTNMKKEVESLERAYSYACASLSVSQNEWIKNSKLYNRNKRYQAKITEFFQGARIHT
jgi:DNA repair protein NreA